MIVNYPHMPTGTRPTRQLFERLVEFALRNNILLVHDNPYSFVRNDEPMSLLAVDGAMDAALELNSLSKGHCMAGWRIGVLTGRKEWIDEVLRFKSNMDSGMFYPLQAAAAEALALGDEWFSALNATYRQRQDKAYELLEALGCTFTHTQAGLFVWASMPADFKGDCFAFSDKVLATCDIFITPGGIFGSEGLRNVRISLCVNSDVLQTAINRIKQNWK